MSVSKAEVQALPWKCNVCGRIMPLRYMSGHLDFHGEQLRAALKREDVKATESAESS